ncbi:MAG: ABC transporter substrate-binding protein [Planctomycetes bacterium]|nr:ABC transporter substrate-binding protein [Planctomycetota bacterium]
MKTVLIAASLLSLLALVTPGCSRVDAASTSQKLVVYTSLDDGTRTPVGRAFETVNPGWEVEFVELESGVALARIRAEAAARPPSHAIASVWWGADDSTLERASREGLLAESTPAWSRTLGTSFHDDKNRWQGEFLQSFSLVSRRGAANVPDKIGELADPKYRGRLILIAPSGVNAGAMFLAEILASRGAWQAGAVDRAFDWIWMLDGNRGSEFAADENTAIDRVIAGEGDSNIQYITIVPTHTAVRARDLFGKSIDIKIPADGVAYVAGIAKLAASPAPEPAGRFMEFVGRDDLVAHFLQHGLLPLPHDRIDAASLPGWASDSVRRGNVYDRGIITDELSNWITRFESRAISGAPLLPSEETGVWWMGIVDVIGTFAILAVLVLLMKRGAWNSAARPAVGQYKSENAGS